MSWIDFLPTKCEDMSCVDEKYESIRNMVIDEAAKKLEQAEASGRVAMYPPDEKEIAGLIHELFDNDEIFTFVQRLKTKDVQKIASTIGRRIKDGRCLSTRRL